MSKNKYVLDLEANALDSLLHAIEHFAEISKPRNTKYVITHLFHAIELFFKARLAAEHPILIYEKIDLPLSATSTTVSAKNLPVRLENIDVKIEKDDKDDIEFLRGLRNSIEHRSFEIDPDQVFIILGRTIKFIFKFVKDELGTDLVEQLDDEKYKLVAELVHSYEERLERAIEKLKTHLPSPRDEYPSRVYCPECGEETILYPDPRSVYGGVECFFCEGSFRVKECSSCGEPMFDADDEDLICLGCWDYKLSRD